MAQEDRNRFAEWWLILREQIPLVRERLVVYGSEVRERPAVLWETPAFRYLVYAMGGAVLAWIVAAIPTLIAPPPPADAQPPAREADYHVVCSNRACQSHFVIRRPFGFERFPVECPKCSQPTGERARRCWSPTCQGRWVAPSGRTGEFRCPICSSIFE